MHPHTHDFEPSSVYNTLVQHKLDAWMYAERGRFILFLPVFMGIGILTYFGRTSEPSLILATTPVAIAAVAVCSCWNRPVFRAAALCAACASAGFADARWSAAQAPPWDDLPHGGTLASGTVTLIETLPKGRRILLKTPSLDANQTMGRNLRIRLRGTDTQPIAAGDRLAVRALVQAPSPPDVPGGWDTQRDAFFSRTGGYGFAIGTSRVIEAAPKSWWFGLRGHIAARIAAVLPDAQGAIASTLLTGLGSAIPADDRAAFQDSGLAHLLAVAGLHIGIVMGLVFAVVRIACAACEGVALRWPARRIAALAALAGGLAYLALTGAHLPILRSFAMAGVLTLGILTGRRAVSLRSLAFAATLLMLWSPPEVVGVGFQMSFSAVLALVAIAEVTSPVLRRLRTGRWWSAAAVYAAGLVLTSLVAGTASLPFAAYHFGRATLYYVPANMLAVPLTALWVLPCGIAALLLMPAGLERLALVPMGVGIDGLLRIAHAVASWPGAAFDTGQLPPASLALVAFGLAWLGLWRSRLRLAGIVPMAAGLLTALLAPLPDIVIGPDAAVLAARIGRSVFLEHAKRATPFGLEAPPRLWGLTATQDFPAEGQAADGAVICDAASCRVQIRGRPAILVRNAASLPCAALLFSAETLKSACPTAVVVDRALVRQAGAVAIRLGETIDLTTDEAIRGDRPWVIRRKILLPPALTE